VKAHRNYSQRKKEKMKERERRRLEGGKGSLRDPSEYEMLYESESEKDDDRME